MSSDVDIIAAHSGLFTHSRLTAVRYAKTGFEQGAQAGSYHWSAGSSDGSYAVGGPREWHTALLNQLLLAQLQNPFEYIRGVPNAQWGLLVRCAS